MDSGLGSDDERKHRTKEQKQQQNQQKQLFSSCFIDASTLNDESDQDIPTLLNDERTQGALIFRNSIRQYSMLQMDRTDEIFSEGASSIAPSDPATPFNSIVTESESPESCHRTPVGFFVDLNDIIDPTPPINNRETTNGNQKNLFSLVIDFQEPKREMPTKLSDSLYNRNKAKSKNTKQEKESVSLQSIIKDSKNSRKSSTSSLPITFEHQNYIQQLPLKSANKSLDSVPLKNKNDQYKATCSHDINNKQSSLSLLNNDSNSDDHKDSSNISSDKSSNTSESHENNNAKESCSTDKENRKQSDYIQVDVTGSKSTHVEIHCLPSNHQNNLDVEKKSKEQFVKLSDLEKQLPRANFSQGPRMVHSIPKSSFTETPHSLCRSAIYRSAPPRPPEPEPFELSDSGSYSDFSISQTTGKSVQRLGTDLLRMFLEEIGPDVTIEVGTYRLRAHKCILSSRCQYFAAVLGGTWLESSGNVIVINGYSYDSVHFALCHIYSGAAHVPDSINLAELAALADMLCLEGLKEVTAHALKLRYCHSFHKPCSGCSNGVLEILPLAATYSLEDLYHKCLRWITQHFVRIWSTRAFASLSKELREKCYKQHVVHMNPDTVISTILKCEELQKNLPGGKWTEPVVKLVKQLSMSCQLYLSQHFCEILKSSAISELNNFSDCLTVLDDKMVEAVRTLGPDHACQSYEQCSKLLEIQSWSFKIQELLHKVQSHLEHQLSRQMSRVAQCSAWNKLNPALKVRVKEMSRLPRPIKMYSPILTSRIPKIENNKERYNPEHAKLSIAINSSIRRNLLLAAKTPQMSTSLYVPRISATLTKATQSSAAKSANTKSNNLKTNQQNVTYRKSAPVEKTEKNKPFQRKANNMEFSRSLPNKSQVKTKTNGKNQELVVKSTVKIKQENKVFRGPPRASLYAPKSRTPSADIKAKPQVNEKKKNPVLQKSRYSLPVQNNVSKSKSSGVTSRNKTYRKEEPKVEKTNDNISSSEESSRTYTKSNNEIEIKKDSEEDSVSKMTRSGTFLKEKPTVMVQNEDC